MRVGHRAQLGARMNFPSHVRVFLSVSPTDMRKQMNGLSVLVREGLGRDPRSGEMFVFHNRRKDMVRVLFFDQQGYCLLSKRMERGVFKMVFPDSLDATSVELNPAQLGEILAGVRVAIENRIAA